jgi:HEAT repeat protein
MNLDDLTLPPERDFAGALHTLADPAQPTQTALLVELSGPTRADVALWRQAWPGVEVHRRRWLCQNMAAAAEADFALHFDPFFIVALDDPDAQVRATAVEALWENEDPHLAERYELMLATDSDAGVRAQAATALAPYIQRAEMEELSPEVGHRLVTALVDAASDPGEDVDVRRRATEAVGFVDTPDVRALIEEHVDSSERALVAGALVAAGRSGRKRWESYVLEYLEAADPLLRFAATQAAGDMGSKKAVPLLLPLAEGDDIEIQLTAIWALGEIGGRQARRALESLAGAVADEELQAAVDDALAMVDLMDDLEPGLPQLRLLRDDLAAASAVQAADEVADLDDWDDDLADDEDASDW